MKPTETQTEYLEMLSYWFEETTGKTLEQEAEEKEISVSYLIEEFILS